MAGRGIRTAMAVVTTAGFLASASSGFAQVLPNPFFSFNYNEYYEQPFVGQPNRYGCVRQCLADFSPCDAPREKQIDGRCKHGA